MEVRMRGLWIGSLFLVFTACSDNGRTVGGAGKTPWDTPVDSSELSLALTPLESCTALQDVLKEAWRKELDRRMAASLREALSLAANANSEGCYGGYPWPGGYGDAGMYAADAASSSPDPNGPKETSGTNNQVANVDEPDLVKHDGKHIYLIASNQLRILKSWPPEETAVLSSVKVEGSPRKLFVLGDRLVVYSSVGQANRDECTYGYGCDFVGDGTATRIEIFDIRDPKAPALLRRLRLSGSLIASRRVNTAVHTVVSSNAPALPAPTTWPAELDRCNLPGEAAIRKAFDDLYASNLRVLSRASITLEATMPTAIDTNASSGRSTNIFADCSGFYRAALSSGSRLTSLISFDLTQQTGATASTVLSNPGAVYATPKALFIAVREGRSDSYGWYGGYETADELTIVHAFALDSDNAHSAYAASGAVKGRGLSQFSMDFYGEHLRIATTSGHLPDPKAHNTVSVLQRQGETLKLVGQLDKLAPGEDIRAVRFAGERGYLVTFKKTDPLFVLDLSTPSAPKVLGELKIPGFSTYMQPMDERHVLALGYDADDQGSFAYFTGIQLQIFDVSDLANPKLKHKTVIGTRGSSSEALTDHLALTYFPARKALALPITLCDSLDGSRWNTSMSFSGLLLFSVSLDSGFAELGRVSHALPEDDKASMCSSWWTQASSAVQRSIFMDDYVFSISERLLKVNLLTDLGRDLATLDLR